MLGADAGLNPLKQFLIRRTEGNPFFLEESVRTLVETKVLTRERGAYQAAHPSATLERARQIPSSAQALLAARIDRLLPERKRLLQAAAVIGTDVPFVLLQAIADEPEAALRQGLAELQAAEFVYETRLFPELEYTFKHALTHEVAYGSLLQERRRALHAGVVAAIEAAYSERLLEHVERLADHAVKGEQWSKAVLYLRQAGMKAYGRSASREAVAYFEQALAALQRLPSTAERCQQDIDVRFDLRNALFLLADIEGGLRYLREAEDLATRLDDHRRLAQASSFICNSVWMLGHSLEARALGRRALDIAESLGDFPLTLGAIFYLGQALMTLGDYRQAEELGRRCIALVGDRGRESFGLGRFPAVVMRAWLAWTLGERGHFREATAFGLEGVQLGEEIGQPFTLAWAYWGLANVRALQGDHEQALRLIERVSAVSGSAGLGIWTTFVAWSRGHLYARLGRSTDGIALLREALAAREARGLRCWNPLVAVHLGEACMSTGLLEEAMEVAALALTVARERSERGHEAYALHLLARLAGEHHAPDVETAEDRYSKALALADECSMRPLAAHCHLGLARLYRHTGKPQQVQEHLATATTMYREMDMQFWLEQA